MHFAHESERLASPFEARGPAAGLENDTGARELAPPDRWGRLADEGLAASSPLGPVTALFDGLF